MKLVLATAFISIAAALSLKLDSDSDELPVATTISAVTPVQPSRYRNRGRFFWSSLGRLCGGRSGVRVVGCSTPVAPASVYPVVELDVPMHRRSTSQPPLHPIVIDAVVADPENVVETTDTEIATAQAYTVPSHNNSLEDQVTGSAGARNANGEEAEAGQDAWRWIMRQRTTHSVPSFLHRLRTRRFQRGRRVRGNVGRTGSTDRWTPHSRSAVTVRVQQRLTPITVPSPSPTTREGRLARAIHLTRLAEERIAAQNDVYLQNEVASTELSSEERRFFHLQNVLHNRVDSAGLEQHHCRRFCQVQDTSVPPIPDVVSSDSDE